MPFSIHEIVCQVVGRCLQCSKAQDPTVTPAQAVGDGADSWGPHPCVSQGLEEAGAELKEQRLEART